MGPMLAKVDPRHQTKLMVFKKGLKGAVVVLIVRAFDNDCVCAPVPHEFSIDFSRRHMSSRVYQK